MYTIWTCAELVDESPKWISLHFYLTFSCLFIAMEWEVNGHAFFNQVLAKFVLKDNPIEKHCRGVEGTYDSTVLIILLFILKAAIVDYMILISFC